MWWWYVCKKYIDGYVEKYKNVQKGKEYMFCVNIELKKNVDQLLYIIKCREMEFYFLWFLCYFHAIM